MDNTKIFHLMNFIVFGVRAVVFGLHKQVFILNPKVLRLVLLDLPDIFLLSTYTLLVLFWAEIYYQVKCLPTDKLRLFYKSINAGIYFIQILAVVSIVAAVCFLFHGIRLFVLLIQFPAKSKGRSDKLFEVGSLAFICATCFLIRCLLAFLSAFKVEASLDALDQPIMDPSYYMLVEILPSALVMFILRKMPPKRELQ